MLQRSERNTCHLYLTLLFLLTAFNACTTRMQEIKMKKILVSVKSIKGDTIISSAVYYAGNILCLREDSATSGLRVMKVSLLSGSRKENFPQ